MAARWPALVAVISLVALAGCGGGGDDNGGGGSGAADSQPKTSTPSSGAGQPVGDRGGREAASAFQDCFHLNGYTTRLLPAPTGASALAAKARGYGVMTVFLNSEKKGILYSTTVTFFDSAAKKDEAKRKLKLDFGSADVPQADERGSAVLRCLG